MSYNATPGEGASQDGGDPAAALAHALQSQSQDEEFRRRLDEANQQTAAQQAGFDNAIDPRLASSVYPSHNPQQASSPYLRTAQDRQSNDSSVVGYPSPGMQTASVDKKKSSRACDACKKRKTRCVLSADDEVSACKPCMDRQLHCTFSHQQKKRGPSKGYIQDVTERVMNIERSIKSGHGTDISNDSETMNNVGELKRAANNPSLMSLVRNFGDLGSRSSPPVGFEDGKDADSIVHYTPGRFPKQYDEAKLQAAKALPLDDGDLERYLYYIHPLTPLLPNSPIAIRLFLAEFAPSDVGACLAALNVAWRSFLPFGQEASNEQREYAMQLINHSSSSNVLRVINLMLMAIDATQLLRDSPVAVEHLARAIATAYRLKLERAFQQPPDLSDLDSADNVSRRVLWSLFILDRWHASSNNCNGVIMDLPLQKGDRQLLGEDVYKLIRYTRILSQSEEAERMINSTKKLFGEFRPRFELTISDEQMSPALQLVKLHVSGQIASLSDSPTLPGLVQSSMQIVPLLRANKGINNTILVFIVRRAALTLLQVRDSGSRNAYNELGAALSSGQTWPGVRVIQDLQNFDPSRHAPAMQAQPQPSSSAAPEAQMAAPATSSVAAVALAAYERTQSGENTTAGAGGDANMTWS